MGIAYGIIPQTAMPPPSVALFPSMVPPVISTRAVISHGTAYRDGGLLIPDPVKAHKFLECAAKQEIAAAQYALGKLYLSDDADVHDPAKGIYWLKRSADNGNDYAAYRLGKEYLSGKNTIKDAETAVPY